MKPLLLSAIIMLAFPACSADNEIIPPPGSTAAKVTFTYEQGTYAGIGLPYRKAVISPQTNTKAAMAIYLHGGTSKGNDNNAPLAEAGVDSISRYLSRHQVYSLLIVPQCPADKSWGGIMGSALKALIDEYLADNTIDGNRIYIFGGSMGGTGIWNMLSSYPGLFAAAMPVAGNPARCNAEHVSQTPIFTVMGTSDLIMNIGTVQDFVSQMASYGGVCILEKEAGWTHETTCIQSYTSRRLEWIFSHSK